MFLNYPILTGDEDKFEDFAIEGSFGDITFLRNADEQSGETFLNAPIPYPTYNKIFTITKKYFNLDDVPSQDSLHSSMYKFVENGDCLLPRPLIESVDRRVIFFCSNDLAGLQIFQKMLGEELIPLRMPSNSQVLLFDTQSLKDSLYFSYLPEKYPASLLVSTLPYEGRIKEDLDLTTIFQDSLLSPDEQQKLDFLENSYVKLEAVLGDFRSDIMKELKVCNRMIVGPADFRNFCVIEPKPHSKINELYSVLFSTTFQSVLSKITGLELDGIIHNEIRCLGPGSYQIFNDKYMEQFGLDVILTFTEDDLQSLGDDTGAFLYLVDGEKVGDFDPLDNIVTLIYRTEGCNRFIPYIPLERKVEIFQFVATYRVIDEQ